MFALLFFFDIVRAQTGSARLKKSKPTSSSTWAFLFSATEGRCRSNAQRPFALELAMTVEAERTWLMIALELARMQVDIKLKQIHGPGTGRIHNVR